MAPDLSKPTKAKMVKTQGDGEWRAASAGSQAGESGVATRHRADLNLESNGLEKAKSQPAPPQVTGVPPARPLPNL